MRMLLKPEESFTCWSCIHCNDDLECTKKKASFPNAICDEYDVDERVTNKFLNTQGEHMSDHNCPILIIEGEFIYRPEDIPPHIEVVRKNDKTCCMCGIDIPQTIVKNNYLLATLERQDGVVMVDFGHQIATGDYISIDDGPFRYIAHIESPPRRQFMQPKIKHVATYLDGELVPIPKEDLSDETFNRYHAVRVSKNMDDLLTWCQ